MKEIMSWLFKDQINSGLTQFDHAQSNRKNALKAKKIKIPQNEFFSRKDLIKFSCTYQPLILQNLIQSYEDKHHFWARNGSFSPNKFFLESYYYHLTYLLAPFIVQNLKKFFQQIQSYEPKVAHFHKWEFFQKTC